MDTLQKMRLFIKVAEAGSFTTAAKLTHSTTSVVSRAISELETHLRTRLLHRTTRKIRLTDAGERYIRSCHDILAAIDRAEAAASDAHDRPEGVIRVHSAPAFGRHYVMNAISLYRKRYPDVRFDVVLSERTPDLIEDGIDISFQMAKDLLPDSAFISRRLGRVFSILCGSPRYLDMAGTPQTVTDLNRLSCLRLNAPFYHPTQWELRNGISRVAFQLTTMPALEINNADALAAALEADLGVGPLPSHTALPALRNGTLRRVLPQYTLQELNVFAVYPSKKYLDAKVRTWVDFMQEMLPAALSKYETEIEDLTRLPGRPTATRR